MGKRIDDTTCHCLKMRRSAWNVVSFYDRMLKPAGITVGQYSLLNGIEEHDGCNISELGMWTELDRSTLVRSLKPLFKAGLICDRKEAGMRLVRRPWDARFFCASSQGHHGEAALLCQINSDFRRGFSFKGIHDLSPRGVIVR